MIDEVTFSRLKTQFNRLSREQQAEVLGMAKAFTFAQRTGFAGVEAVIDVQSAFQNGKKSLIKECAGD
ncbi:MAG: hypothetical protein LBI94_04010 [Treponema sp.]|nr:hypothetical protein [Treponema sp.]